jgi:hypothetical protein
MLAQESVTKDPFDKDPHNTKFKGTASVGVDSKPLKATVPARLVDWLDITDSDKLEWKMEILNGQHIAIVRKVSASNIT